MTFGEKLKKARLALNYSQSEVAELSGISERSLYTYEQTGTMPRSGNIRKLAEVLNVSVGYLMDEDETDTMISVCIPVAVSIFFRRFVIDHKIPRGILVKSSDNVQKRCFSASGRPQH